jgi:hypothetical protein
MSLGVLSFAATLQLAYVHYATRLHVFEIKPEHLRQLE